MIEKYTDADFTVTRNPALYYAFLDIAKSVDAKQQAGLKEIHDKMRKEIGVLQSKQALMEAAAESFMEESTQAVKLNHKQFSSLEQEDDTIQKYRSSNLNFVVVLSHLVKAITNTYEEVYRLTRKLEPPSTMSMGKKNTDNIEELNQFMAMQAEIQLNGQVLEQYVRTLAIVNQNADVASSVGEKIFGVLESYYKMLLHRHSNEGMKIFKNPVITDVALRIFENIDAHGEIESGRTSKQVSAYTIRKAETLTKALKDDMVSTFINEPGLIIDFISDALHQLDEIMISVNLVFESQMTQVFDRFSSNGASTPKSTLKETLRAIRDVNPLNVSFSESTSVKTESEELVDNIRNQTLEGLADMLLDKNATFQAVVQYVLERKAELRTYFHEENSFYTCKISEGNPFSGEAPGALQVVPAERPKGNMENILGSGFDEVREFAESIKSSAKWHDLFLATSPSGSTDKSNVLLIGPQGCGKTEVMRAVGASKDSIGIFAQGSDFQTCWKGEAEKNPKRMFQEGIKLNKESGKHVHFLIDEIDAVLNNDRDSSGGSNLTLEFQILMDGVVAYPNLSVWGATNNPERIPMPMMRRFSKVLIVGELNQDERVKLLKHFLDKMPLGDIEEAKWQEWGRMLEGATGDVIRKIADYLWRTKMNKFVNRNPTDAEAVMNYLTSKGKFSIDKFDKNEFKKVLGKFMTISPKDVAKSVDENLLNVAVRAEIQTAITTYDRARMLLNKINNRAGAVIETA